MATWCTTTDVSNLTGVTVSDPQLLQAQGVIETHVDIDPAAPGEHLKVRDIERLRKALAYQAGWMFEQIDVFSRTDVSQLMQDGIQFTYAHPDAVDLAPLAKRNIDQLSWNQAGAVEPYQRNPYPGLPQLEAAVLRDEVDVIPWVFESWEL